jgi:hypothetical protein
MDLTLHCIILKGVRKLAQAVILLTSVQEAPDSNLNWDTHYFDKGCLVLLNLLTKFLKPGQNCFHPQLLQFIYYSLIIRFGTV